MTVQTHSFDELAPRSMRGPQAEVPVADGFQVKKFVENFDVLVESVGGALQLRHLVLRHGLTRGFDGTSHSRWKSGTVGDFASFLNGYGFKSEWFAPDGVRLLRNANVSHGYLDWSETARLRDDKVGEFDRFSLSEGDIVVSLDRPIISTGVKVARLKRADLPCLLLQRVAKVSARDAVDPDFLFVWLASPLFTAEIDPGRSNGVPHISTKGIEGIPMFLPPLPEQRRIVAKIDQLMGQIDELEAKQTKKREVQTRFRTSAIDALAKAEGPEELATAWKRVAGNFGVLFERAESVSDVRSAILALAVRGRIVPPDLTLAPLNVPTVSSTADRRGSRNGPLSFDHSDLPETWRRVAAEMLCSLIIDGDHNPPARVARGIPHLTAKNIRGGRIETDGCSFISQESFQKSSRRYSAKTNDVLLTCVGSLGRTAIVKNEVFSADRNLAALRPNPAFVEAEYLDLLLRGPDMQHLIATASGSTAQPHIYLNDIRGLPCAIPPLAEQKRIVAKVDQLIKLCDALEAKLKTKEATAGKLVEAVVQVA